jgi:uncharacterized membrane protein
MGKIISTFLISMVPVIELRGAIPIAAAQGMNPWEAMLISVIGNMVPVPFIIVFIRSIFKWMRTRSDRLDALVTRMENKASLKAEKVQKYEKFGLFIFVGIPLPGTGAWTGALIAAMLDMRLKDAVPMIFLGVVAAGMIVTLLTLGVISL